MSNNLKIALVGCGGMARLYRHIYTKIDGVELYMLIDVNEQTAKAAAEELGVERWSTNFEDCLCDEVDIVDISTPNFFHKDQTIAAIKAGKSVLLQKPVTVTVAEAFEIAEAQKKYGANVGVYMEMRSHPVCNEARDIVQKGLLGTITSTRARKAYPTGLNLKPEDWRSDITKTGGGGFVQLGVHNIDLCMWILGERIKSVFAYSANNLCPNMDGDDLTVALVEYENGICGVIETAYNSPTLKEFEIYGSEGYVIINEPDSVTVNFKSPYNGSLIKYNGDGEQTFKTGFVHRELYRTDNPYEQHIAFINAIKEGREVPVDFSEGLFDMQIIDSVYKSAKEKKYINLKDEWRNIK